MVGVNKVSITLLLADIRGWGSGGDEGPGQSMELYNSHTGRHSRTTIVTYSLLIILVQCYKLKAIAEWNFYFKSQVLLAI